MTTKIKYLGYHFPPEIIRRAIWPQTRRRPPNMTPIEEVDGQKVFELHHALADTGLANPKRLRAAAETAMLRDLQGLNHRGQFYFRVNENPFNRWGRLTRASHCGRALEKQNHSKKIRRPGDQPSSLGDQQPGLARQSRRLAR